MENFKEISESIEKPTGDAKSSFNPDKLIEPSEVKEVDSPSPKFDPDKFIDLDALLREKAEDASAEKGDTPTPEPNEPKLYSTSEARKHFAESSKGTWSGEPGNSDFVPDDASVRKTMKGFGETCIHYRDGVVDFAPFSKETVSIDIAPEIEINRSAAYKAVAEKWNAEMKDNRSDWTMRDVRNWKMENNLEFHECSDMRTVHFIPADIHKAARHLGGRHEATCKDAITNGGGFDD